MLHQTDKTYEKPYVYKRICGLKSCDLSRYGDCSSYCGDGFQKFRLTCSWTSLEFTLPCTRYTGCTGGWGSWERFGECSTTCDEGKQLIYRKCESPFPGHNSPYCDGESVKYEYCYQGGCPGSWSCWEDHGQCSTSCGNGTQIRHRRCDNPAPTNNGVECSGKNGTQVHCNIKECPVYKWGHLKDLNLTKDDLKEIMKEELDDLKSNLILDSKNISATIRKRISARDDRPSAAYVGYVGVVLLLIPLVILISLDAPKYLTPVANIYRKVCKRKSVKIANAE
ncbi:HMCN [Mytilus edulis]|uniref:HMCN n=1 Tax=Mytilus edulis TaxID=6550 RepID=A0A8S3TJ06_MYTED|nr:HMCN [Mytilus edulis]